MIIIIIIRSYSCRRQEQDTHFVPGLHITHSAAPTVFPGVVLSRGHGGRHGGSDEEGNNNKAFLRETKSPCRRRRECGVRSQVLGWKSSED